MVGLLGNWIIMVLFYLIISCKYIIFVGGTESVL